jgi:hypothetical protein
MKRNQADIIKTSIPIDLEQFQPPSKRARVDQAPALSLALDKIEDLESRLKRATEGIKTFKEFAANRRKFNDRYERRILLLPEDSEEKAYARDFLHKSRLQEYEFEFNSTVCERREEELLLELKNLKN